MKQMPSSEAPESSAALYTPEPEMIRWPADISQISPGDYEMEATGSDCKMQYANQSYVISINGNVRNDLGGQIKSDGCFKRTFRNGILRPGDNVVVRVNGTGAFSDTVPGGNGGSHTGGGNSGGYPSPTPAPQVPDADIAKVRITAENNARCMANAVVASYGRVERYRYNYYMGLRNGISIYNLVNLGSLQNTSDYIAGAQQGSIDGANNGLAQGRSEGVEDGNDQGRVDARSRFTAVVDTGNPPDRSVNIPNPSFAGLTSGQQARNIEQRLAGLDSDIASWLGQQSFSYDGWSYGNRYGDYWSASKLYGWNTSYQFDLVNSWYRDDWAFQLWKEQKFSRCSNQYDYYEKLADSSQTGNSYTATSAFRSAFKNEYDNVIGSKWRNEVTKSEPVAFSFGQQHGIRVAKDYARDVGYYASYNSNYSNASVQGHAQTFDSAYQNGFKTTFQNYESNPVVEGIEIDFKTNNSRQAFGAGSPINIVLKRAVNVGLKDGVMNVRTADNIVLGQQKQVTLKKSETLKSPIGLNGIGFVGFSAAPNAQTKITVLVGSPSSHQFKVDWAATIYNMATSTQANIKTTATNYIKNNLASEWSKMNSGLWPTNRYTDNQPSNTLLEQMVGIYENPNSGGYKGNIKAAVPTLRTILGARPSGLFAGRAKDRWDSANALFDRMTK